MKKIVMKDECLLREYRTNKYGEMFVYDEAKVPCLFNFTFSQNHSNFVDNEISDATAYVDIDDMFVNENMMRLEGMYFLFNRYGQTLWYKITKTSVGRTLLTDNQDNNVFLNLQKTVPIKD